MKKVAVFGATGSIGKQALDVIDKLGWQVVAATAGSNLHLLQELAYKYSIPQIAVRSLKNELADDLVKRNKLISFAEAIEVAKEKADVVVNAVSGFAGLEITIAFSNTSKRIALANKESVVCGGKLLKGVKAEIVPIDSEHTSLLMLSEFVKRPYIARFGITASGGAIRDVDNPRDLSAEEVLRHPNWNMGAKITVDSATMFNKALEVVEACWYFDVDVEDVEVVLHRQSYVHSFLRLVDGSLIFAVSDPDMRFAINYALTYPEVRGSFRKEFNVNGDMEFCRIDEEKYPLFFYALDKFKSYGESAMVALNAADECAVEDFLRGSIRFGEVIDRIIDVVERVELKQEFTTIREIEEFDKYVRERYKETFGK